MMLNEKNVYKEVVWYVPTFLQNMCTLGVCACVHLEDACKDRKQSVTIVLFSG